MYKFVIVSCLVAVAFAQRYGYDSGYEHSSYGHEHEPEEHHEPGPYSFEYSVHDSKTGDYKQAKETREGGVVKGYYTLKEADGTTREVHYTADKHNGFTAHVTRSGTPHYPAQHQSNQDSYF